MKTFEEFLNEVTISTNDKTTSQLMDHAKKHGIEVKLNKSQSLARQKQQVVDAIRGAGHRIVNTMATKLQ